MPSQSCPLFSCDHCSISFLHEYGLKQHRIVQRHPKKTAANPEGSYGYGPILNQYLSQIVGESGRKKCLYCDRSFKGTQALEFHLISGTHGDLLGWEDVPTVPRQVTADKSKSQTTEAIPRPAKATPKSQPTPDQLLPPKEEDRPIFFCDLCPKQFVNKLALRAHIFSPAHPKSGLDALDPESLGKYLNARIYKKAINCGLCQRDFIDRRAAQQHRNTAHSAQPKGPRKGKARDQDLDLRTFDTPQRSLTEVAASIDGIINALKLATITSQDSTDALPRVSSPSLGASSPSLVETDGSWVESFDGSSDF